jgi:hypothetical protein
MYSIKYDYITFFSTGHASEWQDDVHKKLFTITNLVKTAYLTITVTDSATLYHNLGMQM